MVNACRGDHNSSFMNTFGTLSAVQCQLPPEDSASQTFAFWTTSRLDLHRVFKYSSANKSSIWEFYEKTFACLDVFCRRDRAVKYSSSLCGGSAPVSGMGQDFRSRKERNQDRSRHSTRQRAQERNGDRLESEVWPRSRAGLRAGPTKCKPNRLGAQSGSQLFRRFDRRHGYGRGSRA